MILTRGCGLCLVLVSVLALPAPGAEGPQAGELFPIVEPFDAGYLKVSDLHTIGYALYGNPQGKPVFVLHGGPGFGCYPRVTQYFNPNKFLIVLHDQRGAGRSRPPGELRQNTTPHLVADIEQLREHLKIDGQILLFGGSWGSTLALAYAETHPEQVSGMVLRGISTGTKAEIGNAFAGPPMRQFFPDAVERLEAAMPPDLGGFNPEALLRLFTGDDEAAGRRVAEAWIRFAIETGKLHASNEEVERGFGDWDPRPATRIDCHYAANRFFLEEGQLLREADRLRDIPTTIINGRYDLVCPPIAAYRLHKRLPRSKLIIVEEAGHSEAEPGITRAMVKAVAEYE